MKRFIAGFSLAGALLLVATATAAADGGELTRSEFEQRTARIEEFEERVKRVKTYQKKLEKFDVGKSKWQSRPVGPAVVPELDTNSAASALALILCGVLVATDLHRRKLLAQ
jgi:hypothetical protein